MRAIAKTALSILAVFLVSSWATGQDKSPIRLPQINRTDPPKPMPADAAVKLEPGVRYVIEHDTPCLVFLSPGGSVSVKKQTGPITIDARFADGTGQEEEREYKGKYIYSFKAIKPGRDELIILPAGSTDESLAKRVTFQVGQMPQPPPGPDPQPPPGPVVSFRVILGYESGQTMTAAQNSVLYGKVVEDYLTANCTGGKAGWRRRDKDSVGDADPTMAAMWNAVKPAITTVPFAAVEVNGKIEIIPIEPTPAAMVAKLKTYRGE